MRATAVYAATVQQERANWMTPDCKGVLCIDVNGVLNQMSPGCIDELAKLLRASRPVVNAVILSYQQGDNHWPETAKDMCPWKPVVDECAACYFTNVHRKGGTWRDERVLFKRDAMRVGNHTKFWVFRGNKKQLIQ